MKVDIVGSDKVESLWVEALVVGVWASGEVKPDSFVKRVDGLTEGAISRFSKKNRKFGKVFESQTFTVSPKKHKFIEKVIVLGLGKEKNLDNYKLRQIASYVGKNRGHEVKSLALYLPKKLEVGEKTAILIVGVGVGDFDPGHHKSEKDNGTGRLENLVIVCEKKPRDLDTQVTKAITIVETIRKVREVVNQPANVATPEYMVKWARKIATSGNLKIEVFSEKQVNEMGMGIMASVAKGSEEDLYFVVMRYLGAGPAGPTLALVGKGITFDSGGISIKPSESMEWMKMDMAGAAACFGTMEVISKLKPKINVICACPLTENLPSGRASKPGDVAKGLSGKTVEIVNTDAEGRLVLSDALTYVQKNYKPDYIVDVATLTGAVVVALGPLATGIMGRPADFVDWVIKSGESTGERIWQLPLYGEYREMLKSYIADIANVSGGKAAGAETGAKFLEDFVDEGQKWAHLDIAGTAWEENDKPYIAKGATGAGVTTLVDLALNLPKR